MERSELEMVIARGLEQLRCVGGGGGEVEDVEEVVEGGGENLEVVLLRKKMGGLEREVLSLGIGMEGLSKENFRLGEKLKDSAGRLEASCREFEN